MKKITIMLLCIIIMTVMFPLTASADNKAEFIKHLGKLNDFPLSEQTIPYFIEVQDGKVISITEKFGYTI